MIKEGSAVTCGICQKETKVSFMVDRAGLTSYDLECQHRNGYCETCSQLVRDKSDVIRIVEPHCDTCHGKWLEDEED